jgi:hypothetical protein
MNPLNHTLLKLLRLTSACSISAVCLTVCATAAFSAKPSPGDLGNQNTGVGADALTNNTTGTNNTAAGYRALFSNTTGDGNTGIGSQALMSNITGNSNAANGFLALSTNTIGSANTANGSQALNFNTVGNENTANGNNALFNNTTGNDNVANGASSAFHNTVGAFNTANGANSLFTNSSGSFNVADGGFSLSQSTGSNNIALGYAAGTNLTTGNFNIDIGNQGVEGESSTIRIGTDGNHVATFIAGINNATVTGTAVLIDANGQLGTILSSRRFKEDVKPMNQASEAVLSLKPVTFRYKHELDAKATPQFGLIAEEVEKVNPALVSRDANGKANSVRYESINAMLLNEFLKEHARVEELESVLARQGETLDLLKSRLERQEAQLQKVNARLDVHQSAARLVENSQ